MIKRMNEHYSMTNPASVYDEEALTSLELVGRTTAKLNEVIEAQNTLENNTVDALETQDAEIQKHKDVVIPQVVSAEVQKQITNGTFDAQINQSLNHLNERVDSLLGSVTEGSTTMDAEVIDLRTAKNGTVYDNAGLSVRTQFIDSEKETIERFFALENITGEIPVYEHTGFLTGRHGTLVFEGDEYKCKYTPKIPCKEGDVFYYMGRGSNNAISWAFLQNDSVVSWEVVDAQENSVEVVIPSGVNYVVFSSYASGTSLNIRLHITHETKGCNILKTVQNDVFKADVTLVNYFDKNSVVDGYLTNQWDNPILDDGTKAYYTSSYIPIYKGEPITISPYRVLVIYNLKKGVYNFTNAENTEPYTYTPQFDGYIRMSVRSRNLDSTMVVKGEVLPSEYVPYERKLTNDIWFSDKQKEYIDKSTSAETGNVLYGKKYVACGDSFTAGDFTGNTDGSTFTEGLYSGYQKVYPYYIGNRNNMTVINEAVNGSTLTAGNNSLSGDRLYAIPLDADYVTIKIGINDDTSHQNKPIGTIDDTDNTTFYGAWNVVLDYLTENMPFAKIGIIVTNGAKQGVVDATLNIAKKWGIPYINLATDDKLPVMLRSLRTDVSDVMKTRRDNAFSVSSSNRHPNAKAHEFESYIIENWLRSI